jgi:hypothetical protein
LPTSKATHLDAGKAHSKQYQYQAFPGDSGAWSGCPPLRRPMVTGYNLMLGFTSRRQGQPKGLTVGRAGSNSAFPNICPMVMVTERLNDW